MLLAFTKSPDAPGYDRYISWLHHHAPDAVVIDVSDAAQGVSVADRMARCDGILFPGGPDIHPRHYGTPEALPLCTVDEERDALELEAFTVARTRGIPVLGVCRGLQVINVALGGTLVPDLPAVGREGHARTARPDHREDEAWPAVTSDATHPVLLHPTFCGGLLLHDDLDIAGRGVVNSSHHQAADAAAPGLAVTARADDGTIEALEWASGTTQPWMLLVQWHPERMDWRAPLSACVMQSFLEAVLRAGEGASKALSRRHPAAAPVHSG